MSTTDQREQRREAQREVFKKSLYLFAGKNDLEVDNKYADFYLIRPKGQKHGASVQIKATGSGYMSYRYSALKLQIKLINGEGTRTYEQEDGEPKAGAKFWKMVLKTIEDDAAELNARVSRVKKIDRDHANLVINSDAAVKVREEYGLKYGVATGTKHGFKVELSVRSEDDLRMVVEALMAAGIDSVFKEGV